MVLDLRLRSRLTGVLILAAYSMLGGGFTESRLLTASLDLVSGMAVIGIAALVFPLVRSSGVGLSRTYVSMKVAEGALMIGAGATLVVGSGPESRSWIYAVPQAYTFIVSAFVFYCLLLRSGIVPRFISVWGIVAIVALLIVNVARSFQISHPALDGSMLLIMTNEIFLAVWLMTRGFARSVHERS